MDSSFVMMKISAK